MRKKKIIINDDDFTKEDLTLIRALIDYNYSRYQKIHDDFCMNANHNSDREELLNISTDIIDGLNSLIHFIKKNDD